MKKITTRAQGMWRTAVLTDAGEELEVEYSWTHPGVVHAQVRGPKPSSPPDRSGSGAERGAEDDDR